MAHEVETMAYVGQAPWHGLGTKLSAGQSVDVWAQEAGMDWQIQQTPVRYVADEEDGMATIAAFEGQQVLFRSDTKEALSVVSNRYQVVQPREVLEFYRDLTEVSGFELETAGVLKGGRKFWALAKTGQKAVLQGGDQVENYILLATSCDGSLATTATPTSVRVVCNNTLTISLSGASQAIKVPHNTAFDAQAVKKELGIAVSQWDEFMYRMKKLAERKVSHKEAENFFRSVIASGQSLAATAPEGALPISTNERALQKAMALFNGNGRGAELSAAKGSAWGLLGSITEFVDHERRARSQDYRLDSAWFGQGAAIKDKALDHALALIA